MHGIWQHVLVGAAAAAALGWLIRDRVRKRRAHAGCESCALTRRTERAPADLPAEVPADRKAAFR